MKFNDFEKQIVRCQTLDELFTLWREAHKAEENYKETTVDGIDKNTFVADGYIDENCYYKSDYKTLFILKEANIKEYNVGIDSSQVGFYTDYINDGKPNIPKQQEKIGRMAYYLQNGENETAKMPSEVQLKNALKYTAFMNINKRGGAKSTNSPKINAYYNKYEQFIKKEIEIINPNCIVIIGTTEANDNINKFAAENKIRTINMWHTAYRMSRQKRSDNPIYALSNNGSEPDKNVDCYMRKFFETAQSSETL
ncbi:MAG: hypothetical protein J1F63_08275 [Oscillospiraceae bacterium]|nr:hypothetical protein [Oscillospiraceae bacterium]